MDRLTIERVAQYMGITPAELTAKLTGLVDMAVSDVAALHQIFGQSIFTSKCCPACNNDKEDGDGFDKEDGDGFC